MLHISKEFAAQRQSSRTSIMVNQCAGVFTNLQRVVSSYCLDLLLDQLNLALKEKLQDMDDPMTLCTGNFTKTMGLPCKHCVAVHLKKNAKFELNHIDSHWWLYKEAIFVAEEVKTKGRNKGSTKRIVSKYEKKTL